MLFGMETLEWCGDQTVKKMKICVFVFTESTNVTDTQTPHDDIGRTGIALRRKNGSC